MSDDVFAQTKGDDGESVLDKLVGDGKKFDSVEALALGKIKADEHISNVEQENADLRSKLEEIQNTKSGETKMDDILDAVKQAMTTKQEDSDDKTLSEDELTDLIRNVLNKEKLTDTKEANRAKGNELVLKLVNGDVEAAKKFVTDRAVELGTTPQRLRELSEESPDMFAQLISPKGTHSSGGTSTLPGARSEALEHNNAVMERNGFKTKAWFDAKRKEVGRVKYLNDPHIQAELARSIANLPLEEFNN